MKAVLMSLVLMGSTAAMADGFECVTTAGDLNIKVYNHVDPYDGTRTGAIMVVSDPSVLAGNKTIATFDSGNGNLTSQEGAIYWANVDSRYSGAAHGGELIGGTRLSELKSIILDVDFSYAYPVADGTELDATLTYEKENGETWTVDAVCARYLKN